MAQPETSNVVGVFDDYSAAERAARDFLLTASSCIALGCDKSVVWAYLTS
jgi:hypothetical protein